MSRRGAGRRSATEWGVRGLLVLIALALAYFSLTRTLGFALRKSDIQRAHDFTPRDGRITALLAGTLAGPTATATDRRRSDQLARIALQQDPTAVIAASTLGLNAQVRGDGVDARRFIAYAETLSRREIAPQLWEIEASVARGDIAAALRHYDIALRTSKQAPDLLFPVLASANSDPAIRMELARTLAGRPAWGASLVDYLSLNGADLTATTELFRRLTREGTPVSPNARAAVLNSLVANGRGDDAWVYYSSFRPGTDRRRSRDEYFTGRDAPTLFDWTLHGEGVNASLQRSGKAGVLDFAAPGSVGGLVLQQVQLFPAGKYRIQGHSSGIDQPAGSRPYWALRCRAGVELGRVDLPNSNQAGGVFSGAFTVPAGCPIQMLQLTVRPSETMMGVSGQIDRITVYPVDQ